jgi:hypothetical protein
MEDNNVGGDGGEVDGDGGGGDIVDGDGSGGIFPSQQGARIDFCPSKFVGGGSGGAGLLLENCQLILGFPSGGFI